MNAPRIAIAVVVLTTSALQACAAGTAAESRGWQSKGENNGFAAMGLLTDDFPALIREWKTTDSPRLKTAGKAKLGGSLNVAFLVAGCRPGSDGLCNITAEIVVKNEKGEARARARVEDVCPDQKARPPKEFMLCGRTPAIDNNGRPEKLDIVALVRDENSGRGVNVKLTAEFR